MKLQNTWQPRTTRKGKSSSLTRARTTSSRSRPASISAVRRSSMSITSSSPRRARRLHIISGCTSGGHVGPGAAHYGVSEFYIRKNAKVSLTMIHTWTENIEVFPRSASIVEENGVFLSNYVCMQPVKKVQMYPTATLEGDNSVARFSTIAIASPSSYIDIGSRAILEGKGASAELSHPRHNPGRDHHFPGPNRGKNRRDTGTPGMQGPDSQGRYYLRDPGN